MKESTIQPHQNNDGDNEDGSLSTLASTDSNTSNHHLQTPESALPSSPPLSPRQTQPRKSFLPMGMGWGAAASASASEEAPPSPPQLVVSTMPPRIMKRKSTRRVVLITSSSSSSSRVAAPTTGAIRVAIDMRTRSSRLFFVLLHLVGVSTIVPSSNGGGGGSSSSSSSANSNNSNSSSSLMAFLQQLTFTWSSTGIVGVHPTAILLSRLHIESSRRGLRGLLDRIEHTWGWKDANDVLGEPYWFQDQTNGKCLDPMGGFSECGDATLWRVRRRPLSKRQVRDRQRRERERRKEERLKMMKGDASSAQPPPQEQEDLEGMNDGEEEGGYFALQLMDVDAVTANSSLSSHRRLSKSARRPHKRFSFWNTREEEEEEDIREDPHAECLLSKAGEGSSSLRAATLQIGSCASDAAWVWNVNSNGILVRGSTKAEKRRKRRRNMFEKAASAAAAADGVGEKLPLKVSEFKCVHKTNATAALLMPCDDNEERAEAASRKDGLVGFSLVRYPSTAAKVRSRQRPTDAFNEKEPSWEPWITLEGPSVTDEAPEIATKDKDAASTLGANHGNAPEQSQQQQHLRTSHTSSHNPASAGAKPNRNKVDLKSTASMLHTSLEQGGGVGGGKAKKDAVATTAASHIRDAPVAMNGVAFHNQGRETNVPSSTGPSSTKLHPEPNNNNKKPKKGGPTPIHDEASDSARGSDQFHHHGHSHHPDSNPHRPRKIPVHPYIQSSKDFVWVDPLTSLEYPTDLCRYLGHTKKEAGRHTLMGVGQYYRTAFNIKVYGAALYVAKRDVLADPKFGEYATLTSEELRDRDDFYEHLMNMPDHGEDPANAMGGFFDRTLFIKINMQLSTDAMRKSLEADWSLLTAEMKSLIINSSFKERMADERMQQKIQSKENSSNCSCGQKAPLELKADPNCCARGTELVFTWRKNGDFEIRLDQRVMDVFPRSDIARGIFSEYMNDNPISLDAKAHFTDGFPFLLAPLAQVKGMSSAVPQTGHESSNRERKSGSASGGSNPMHRFMDAAVHSVGAMNTQAHTLSKWMQDGAVGMTSSAMGSALGVARGLTEELDRQRMELVEGAVALQKEGMEMLSLLIKQSTEGENNGLALSVVNQAMPSLSPFSNGFDTYNNEDVGFSPLEIMPDEIGIKIEPTMNFTHRLFFTTVHVYLLLLFVLSLPGSYTKRWVVKRRILETKKFVASQSQGAFAAMSKLH